MSKIYSRFETETAQKPNFWGGTYLHGLYKGVPQGFLKADLDGKIFAYDYRAQLACNFSTGRVVYIRPTTLVRYIVDVVGINCTRCGWLKVMTYASRAR